MDAHALFSQGLPRIRRQHTHRSLPAHEVLMRFTGGCVCGAVRYECAGRPLAMFNCHCRTCQKVTGGAYTPVVLLSSKAFKVTQGALRYHFTERLNGSKHKRGFCAECGSRITGAEEEQPGR